MIRALLLFSILCFSHFSQAQFSPAQYIHSDMFNTRDFVLMDANQDGHVDMVRAHWLWSNDIIQFYLNNSNGQFSLLVPSNFQNLGTVHAMAAGDIDGDGHEDLVLSHGTFHTLAWYRNDGTNFAAPVILDSVTDFSSQIIVADFNNDGRNDILQIQHVEIVIYWQSASGAFEPRQVIFGTTEFYGIEAADFNGDGYLDVAVASGGFDIVLNNQNKSFSPVPGPFGQGLHFSICAADLNGDGHIDLIANRALFGLYAYINNGQGTQFGIEPAFVHSDQLRSIAIMDGNDDGHPDIITTIGQSGQIILVPGNGNGTFLPHLVIHQQTGQLVYHMHCADMNNNGLQDIVWSSLTAAIHYRISTISVDEPAAAEVMLFPNPSTGVATIKNPKDHPLKYTLTDAQGREIGRGILPPTSETNFDFVTKGFYIIRLDDSNNGQSTILKLVVQ